MSPSNQPRPQTKSERRAAAREQARALREAQERRERRNRLLLVGAIVGIVAIVVVAVVVILGQSGRSALADVDSPAGSTEAGGIRVGAEGVGATNEGAPVVQVYSDFMCPFCGMFEQINAPVLEELSEAGLATVDYHPVAFLDDRSLGTEYSTRAAQAAAVVADGAPEQFSAFWFALFAVMPEQNTPGLSDEEIAQVAREAGVPEDVIEAIGDDQFRPWVRAATEQATRDLPRPATPSVLIDGEPWQGDWQDPANLRAAVVGDQPEETPAG